MKGQAQREKERPERKGATGGKRIARNAGGELPIWFADGSGPHAHKPAPPTHPLLGSSPIIPALFLLLVAAVLLSSGRLRNWQGSAENLPGVAEFSAFIPGVAVFSGFIQRKQSPVPPARVSVWARRQSGFYYCRGGVVFGSKPGRLMKQAEALVSGYRPAEGHYCTASTPSQAPLGNAPFGNFFSLR
jgi:hypothetical protein